MNSFFKKPPPYPAGVFTNEVREEISKIPQTDRQYHTTGPKVGGIRIWIGSGEDSFASLQYS